MKDVVGWVALAISLVGHLLAAKGDRRGWVIRSVAGFVWLAFACIQQSAPYVATAVIYLGIDCYGSLRRRVRT